MAEARKKQDGKGNGEGNPHLLTQDTPLASNLGSSIEHIV
jgi:hypothetical protein